MWMSEDNLQELLLSIVWVPDIEPRVIQLSTLPAVPSRGLTSNFLKQTTTSLLGS